MNYLKYCFIITLLLTGCSNPETKVSTGPFVNAGPVGISATIDNDGVVTIDGTFQQTFIGIKQLGFGWQVGFETTLNEAKNKQHTLYILHEDNQGVILRQEYDINQPFEVNFENDQWVKKIVHDGNGNIVVYAKTNTLFSQANSGSRPIFDHVVQREKNSNGQLVIDQDVYFKDPDGDAYLIEYDLQSVNPKISGIHFENDPIDASPSQQKNGTYQTITWECGLNKKTYTVTLRAIILDRAGYRSSPFSITFNCR